MLSLLSVSSVLLSFNLSALSIDADVVLSGEGHRDLGHDILNLGQGAFLVLFPHLRFPLTEIEFTAFSKFSKVCF